MSGLPAMPAQSTPAAAGPQATIADVIRAVMRSMRSSLDDDDRAGLQMKLDNHSQKLPNSGAELIQCLVGLCTKYKFTDEEKRLREAVKAQQMQRQAAHAQAQSQQAGAAAHQQQHQGGTHAGHAVGNAASLPRASTVVAAGGASAAHSLAQGALGSAGSALPGGGGGAAAPTHVSAFPNRSTDGLGGAAGAAAGGGVQQGQTVEDGVAGKRKADTDGDGVASESAKKAKEADGEPYNSLSGLIHEDEEKKAMQRLNSLRKCTFKCTDVPFLQYDKDGPRRTGPLVQYVQTLLSRHPGDVVYMDNLAIDLLSLACEQHMRNTIEKVVEASHHRSGSSPAFSALRVHKHPAAHAAADSAHPQAGLAGPAGSADAQAQAQAPAAGSGAHQSFMHADLQVQEAARRASAPHFSHKVPQQLRAMQAAGGDGSNAANGVLHRPIVEGNPPPDAQGAREELKDNEENAVQAAGGHGDVVMTESVDDVAGSGGGHSVDVAGGANGANRAELDEIGGRHASGVVGAGEGNAKGILLKDILFILEKEKSMGVRRIHLKHSVRQDPALRSWRSSH